MSKGKGDSGSHSLLRKHLAQLAQQKVDKNAPTEKKFNEENFIESCLHFAPSPRAQYLMFSRADKLLDAGQYLEAAECYTRYQALTFKQQFLQQLNKKKLKTSLDVGRGKLILDSATKDGITENHQQILGMLDHHQESSLDNILKGLPTNWTILQISCYTSLKYTRFKTTKKDVPMNEGNPNLVLVRLNSDSSGVTVRKVMSPESTGTTPYLLELQNILEEMVLIVKEGTSDRYNYWNMRQRLNDKMKSLVESVEDAWLGPVKTMLLGNLPAKCKQKVNEVYQEVMDLLQVPKDSSLETRIKLLLSGAKYLSIEQIFSELYSLYPNAEKDSLFSASKLIEGYTKTVLDFESECRDPVILLLDPDLLGFPWESLPCTSTSKQAMSRLPSLQYLATMWKVHEQDTTSVINEGISHESVFYMINPDKSLPKTQERLEGVMKGFAEWEGISGKAPKPGQLADALIKKDAYIYAGHGSGHTFMSSEEVKRLRIRSVPILLGCRSAELTRYGRNLDPFGVVHSYLVGSSPALAGFLWPVSDADLDQWTIQFLQHWVTGKEKNLLQAVVDQRCKFKHITNSAALVVYGFPISIKLK